MIKKLSDFKEIEGLFNVDGNLQDETALAHKLFQEGIKPKEPSPNNLHERFKSARNKQGNLVFYPSGTTSNRSPYLHFE